MRWLRVAVLMRAVSAVQRAAGQGQHALAEQLAHGRVGLDELGDFVDGGLPIDGQVPLAELLGDPGSNHVHAKDFPPVPSGCFSAMIFTRPSVSPTIMARPLPVNRCFETTTS